jgi:hypothetical protein
MVFNATFNIISVVKNLPSPYNKDLGPLARIETGNSRTPLRSLPDGYKKSHVLHLKAFLMKTKKNHYKDISSWLIKVKVKYDVFTNGNVSVLM